MVQRWSKSGAAAITAAARLLTLSMYMSMAQYTASTSTAIPHFMSRAESEKIGNGSFGEVQHLTLWTMTTCNLNMKILPTPHTSHLQISVSSTGTVVQVRGSYVYGPCFENEVVVKYTLASDICAQLDAKAELDVGKQLRHPNIVQLLGWYQETSSSPPCLILEKCDCSLHDMLKGGGPPLTLHQMISIIFEVLMALAYAERKGLVHFDIKPANVLLQAAPVKGGLRAKVADWGISLCTGTPTFYRGTPGFMAPEVMAADSKSSRIAADPRADTWSVGAMMLDIVSTSTKQQMSTSSGPGADSTADASSTLSSTCSSEACSTYGIRRQLHSDYEVRHATRTHTLFSEMKAAVAGHVGAQWLDLAEAFMHGDVKQRPLPSQALEMMLKQIRRDENGSWTWCRSGPRQQNAKRGRREGHQYELEERSQKRARKHTAGLSFTRVQEDSNRREVNCEHEVLKT